MQPAPNDLCFSCCCWLSCPDRELFVAAAQLFNNVGYHVMHFTATPRASFICLPLLHVAVLACWLVANSTWRLTLCSFASVLVWLPFIYIFSIFISDCNPLLHLAGITCGFLSKQAQYKRRAEHTGTTGATGEDHTNLSCPTVYGHVKLSVSPTVELSVTIVCRIMWQHQEVVPKSLFLSLSLSVFVAVSFMDTK